MNKPKVKSIYPSPRPDFNEWAIYIHTQLRQYGNVNIKNNLKNK